MPPTRNLKYRLSGSTWQALPPPLLWGVLGAGAGDRPESAPRMRGRSWVGPPIPGSSAFLSLPNK